MSTTEILGRVHEGQDHQSQDGQGGGRARGVSVSAAARTMGRISEKPTGSKKPSGSQMPGSERTEKEG